jgi:hypothetical protein
MTIFCKGENYAACKNCIACVVDYGCNRVRCRAKGVEITSIAYEDNDIGSILKTPSLYRSV